MQILLFFVITIHARAQSTHVQPTGVLGDDSHHQSTEHDADNDYTCQSAGRQIHAAIVIGVATVGSVFLRIVVLSVCA